jgi:hypothetical protein
MKLFLSIHEKKGNERKSLRQNKSGKLFISSLPLSKIDENKKKT